MTYDLTKVFITKYALSDGIIIRYCDISDGKLAVVRSPFLRFYHGEGREWHRTFEGAVAKAEDMRTKKLASLRRKLVELENRKFDKASDKLLPSSRQR